MGGVGEKWSASQAYSGVRLFCKVMLKNIMMLVTIVQDYDRVDARVTMGVVMLKILIVTKLINCDHNL